MFGEPGPAGAPTFSRQVPYQGTSCCCAFFFLFGHPQTPQRSRTQCSETRIPSFDAPTGSLPVELVTGELRDHRRGDAVDGDERLRAGVP